MTISKQRGVCDTFHCACCYLSSKQLVQNLFRFDFAASSVSHQESVLAALQPEPASNASKFTQRTAIMANRFLKSCIITPNGVRRVRQTYILQRMAQVHGPDLVHSIATYCRCFYCMKCNMCLSSIVSGIQEFNHTSSSPACSHMLCAWEAVASLLLMLWLPDR